MNNKYPWGKLNEDDEGHAALAIHIESNVLRIDFAKPMAWIGLDKKTALEFVAALNKGISKLVDDN